MMFCKRPHCEALGSVVGCMWGEQKEQGGVAGLSCCEVWDAVWIHPVSVKIHTVYTRKEPMEGKLAFS